MKILILQDHLRIGGTEKQSLFLARFFREAGEEAGLLTFRPGGHLQRAGLGDDLPVRVLQRFDSRISLWAPGLTRAIRETAPEVILCMGRTANCYAGFLQKRFPGIPVVGTLRTGKVLFPLHHWSMGRVRAVLVNSNWWKRRLLERGFPPERIHVAHNAVLLERSPEEARNTRIRTRETYRIDDRTCVFLNVATFRPGKRHFELLQVFSVLRKQNPDLDWRLWLVGDGREYKRCRQWAAANGLGTRVRFFHFQDDPFPFYAAADVAVSASREDSLPNFLVEAQAARLPVVAYDCRGVKETCDPGRTGIILPAGSHRLFLNALVDFIVDPEKRARFAAGAPELARKRFSQEPQARAVLDFLRDLVENPR